MNRTKKKATLFSQTLKVEESKVPLDFFVSGAEIKPLSNLQIMISPA